MHIHISLSIAIDIDERLYHVLLICIIVCKDQHGRQRIHSQRSLSIMLSKELHSKVF